MMPETIFARHGLVRVERRNHRRRARIARAMLAAGLPEHAVCTLTGISRRRLDALKAGGDLFGFPVAPDGAPRLFPDLNLLIGRLA